MLQMTIVSEMDFSIVGIKLNNILVRHLRLSYLWLLCWILILRIGLFNSLYDGVLHLGYIKSNILLHTIINT